VFFERATGVFVGRGGLRRTTVAGAECVEVLYAVRPDAWGRGYATEMARLALGEGRRMGLVEVVGIAATTNVASRRVLEKAGLRIEATVQHAGIPHWLGRVRAIV
jgi:[ribosomal protein S5]-alanine N-acetyltransferase